jgi:hypothetical protein
MGIDQTGRHDGSRQHRRLGRQFEVRLRTHPADLSFCNWI